MQPAHILHCPDLAAEAWRFDHASGLTHWHLTTHFPQQVFVLAVPTAMEESTGAAHILEHLALCGSRRFPVRGVFDKMRQRSVASFMNAMTGPTDTRYVFATPHQDDFHHLSRIYLDAVFQPLLSPADFAQEGWRWDDRRDGNPTLNGVVYNEMKGAYQDTGRAKFRALFEVLAPGTALAHDSGGHPAHIPTLAHEHVLALHARHYHPRRCVVVTAGPLDLAKFHANLDELVPRHAPDEPVWPVTIPVPRPPESAVVTHPGDASTASLSRVWLLPVEHGEDEWQHSWMATALLLQPGNALLEALHDTGGTPDHLWFTLSPFEVGLVHHQPLVLGVQGHHDHLAALLPSMMVRWRDPDFDAHGLLSTVLDRFEEHLGGLVEKDPRQLVEKLASELVHVPPQLSGGAWIVRQRQRLAEGQAWSMVQAWMDMWMSRPCTRVVHQADPTWNQALRTAEERHQAVYLASGQPLRQETTPAAAQDAGLLPSLAASQLLPPFLPSSPRHWIAPNRGAGVASIASTAAFGQVQVDMDVGHWKEDALRWLHRWSLFAPILGAAGRRWSEQASLEQTQGMSCQVGLHAHHRHPDNAVVLWLSLGMHGPADQALHMTPRLLDRWNALRYDEVDAFEHHARQLRSGLMARQGEQRFDQVQHAAGAPFSGVDALLDSLWGVEAENEQLAWLDACLASPSVIHDALRHFEQVGNQLRQAPKLVSALGRASIQHQGSDLATHLPGPYLASPDAWSTVNIVQPSVGPCRVWPGHAGVCHASLACPAPGVGSEEEACWYVLAGIIGHTLHRRIREEGGAYGAYATMHPGCLVMSSYRDPAVQASLETMYATVRGLGENLVGASDILAAQTVLAQQWWRPLSPENRARASLLRWKLGTTDDIRQHLRTQILCVTPHGLWHTARHWLAGAQMQGARTDTRAAES